MSSISFYENDKTPNSSLFVDFAAQHQNNLTQYFDHQGADLNTGCPDMNMCKPSCNPMFFCPDKMCPPGSIHNGANCMKISN